MRRLEKDESLCIGCHQCEEACSKAFYKVSDPMKSCIRITDKEDGSHHIAVCTQCGKCSEVCNTGVITEDARGVYRLNKKECAGCLMCVGFCPENVMVQCDDYLEPSKCTACGLCVKACPTDAWKATPGYEVSFGGLFGNRVYKGENYLPLVTSEEQLFRITDAAIQFFDDNANPGERFRMTLERVGLDKFEEKIKEAYNG